MRPSSVKQLLAPFLRQYQRRFHPAHDADLDSQHTAIVEVISTPGDASPHEIEKRINFRSPRRQNDQRRRQRRLASLADDIPGRDDLDPALSVARTELLERVKEALARLKPQYRKVLVDYYYLDLTFDQIANQNHCKPQSVHMLATRAKKALRQKLYSIEKDVA